MEWFRIAERFSYNEFLDVCVWLGEMFTNQNEITSQLPFHSNPAVLIDGKLMFQSAAGNMEILDEQKSLYFFEINKNKLPPALRLESISSDPDADKASDSAALFNSAGDYVQVTWSLSETWWLIGQLFTQSSKEYTFESRDFVIERKVVHNGQHHWEAVNLKTSKW